MKTRILAATVVAAAVTGINPAHAGEQAVAPATRTDAAPRQETLLERVTAEYWLAPEKSVHLTAEEAAGKPPNFLVDDLTQRIAKKPVVFHLKVQLAAAGDQTKDPSQPWPDDRRVVDLGVLTLDTPVADSLEAQKKLLFLPNRLTDGIELSDDRLPVIRSEVYALSFARRGN
jgi:catalase